MIFGKCKDCKKRRFLTKHSKFGQHTPPWVLICRPCHDKRHDMNPPRKRQKINKKYQPGTPKSKRKKK